MTRCQGPTAACSPSGNGPKWKTEYLIRTNCCLYQRLGKTTQKACHSEGNTRRGKKRKNHGVSKVDPNPTDLDILEDPDLLAEFSGQRASIQEASPRPRKRKRQSSGGVLQHTCRKSQDHFEGQKDSRFSTPSTDEAELQNKVDLHGDKCPPYPVYIRMWDGRLLTADVADDSTARELHKAVRNVYGNHLPKEAAFYRGGVKVTQGKTLKHQGIVAESTVEVLLKLKGGGDRGDAEASGEAQAATHMTEWTVEEAVQWLQTEGKMRPDEVKPLVEEHVDGLALWEIGDLTVESVKNHFSHLSGGAVVKLRKALKIYKKNWPNFEHVILPGELPANVTSWREKDIKSWLSQVVKFTPKDVDSLCTLDLDGDSLLILDEETVVCFLPEMKKGPLIKLFSCLNRLNSQQNKQKTEVENVIIGEDKKAVPVSNVEAVASLDEAGSNTSDDVVTPGILGAAGDTTREKATEVFVSPSGLKIQSKEIVASNENANAEEQNATKKKTAEVLMDVSDTKNESQEGFSPDDSTKTETSTAEKDGKNALKCSTDLNVTAEKALVEEKGIELENTSVPLVPDKEPKPASSQKQVSHQKPAQVQPAQPSSTKSAKLTEKETTILHLLKSSGLNLYEPPLTQSPKQCEISLMYARPKKKNELDLLFNFLVIRKVSEGKPSGSSHTKHLWDTIRKNLSHWVEILPKKSKKDYYVDKTATSSEYVFRTKDKNSISLSKKDPTCVPLGQVDMAVLKSMNASSTVFVVEESFKTEEQQEYIIMCGAKDSKYYFQYSKNDNWHASFNEGNLMQGLVLKPEETKMTVTSERQPLEKKVETENLSVPTKSPKQSSPQQETTEKTPGKSEKETAVGASIIPDRSAKLDVSTGTKTSDYHEQKRPDTEAYQSSDSSVGGKPTCSMGDRQGGTEQKSVPFTPVQLSAPLTLPPGHASATPSTFGTKEALGPGRQRPFPFDRSDTGNFSYKRGAVLTVMESGSGSLLSPSHEFKVFQQIKPTDRYISFGARDYFIYETLRFASGCINARSNGTIHFGVGDDVGGKYQHGEIVGIGLQEKLKTKFDDMIKDAIPTCFRQDWAISSVNQCINPVRFIPVYDEHLESKKYVIEVDVVPTYALTQSRAFFIRFPPQMKRSDLLSSKIQSGECLYYRERASTPCYRGSKLDDFQNNLLPKLAQDRDMQEKNSTSQRPSYNHEYNAKKLEGCLLGGEPDLRTRYPILFVSKPDAQCKHGLDITGELSFIAEIPWIAIFDLDPNSDDNGICNLLRSRMKKECSLYQPEEKFFHFSDHEELADAILFPEKTCWIFANGRHALEVEPHEAKRWNGTERCKAVKNATSFFSRPDKIPPGKAVIVFLVLSEEIDIMVSCFRYCFDDFCGIDNFLCLFENENAYELWENQVQSVCGPGDLQRKSIVGMPWAHINQTVQFINGLKVQTEPLIPTSSGSNVLLTNQYRNKLDDLEVLSKNQCDDLGLDPESDYFEELCQKKELLFYKGNEVDWLNFFFTEVHNKNHVMTRDKFSELHKLVSAALFYREPQLKRKSSVIITLYYQAGSGATTLGRHILWAFRKSSVRCCVILRITDDTAKQILELRSYGEETENECFPVLVLIDNKNEELVQNLIASVERLIKNKGIITEKPVCIILQCRRTQDAKKHCDSNPTDSEYLEQRVSGKEMKWLEKKQKELEETILEEDLDMSFSVCDSDSDSEDTNVTISSKEKENTDLQSSLNLDKDPHLFIKFMILRKNFDKDFVRNVVVHSLKDVKGNEFLLLRYTALLNVFAEKEDSYVPVHCAEALMGIDKNKYLTMNNILSPAVKVFLIKVERLTCGIVQGYKFVDPVLANEVLIQMLEMQQTYSSIACEFLESRLFSDAYSTKDLIFFTKEMLKRRKKFAYGDETETLFSLLVERICEKETYQAAVPVLQKGLDKFGDPMIAQTLARLFTKHNDFTHAHEFATIAVDLDSDNSYLLVTAGKVYHEEMIKNFEKLNRRIITLSMLKNTMSLAMSAVKQYSQSQEANRRGKYAPNLHCYLEDIKTCFKFLSMMNKVDPFKGSVGQAILQRYLVAPEFIPDEVQEVWKEYHIWIKSIKGRIDVSIDFLEKDLTYNKQRTRDLEFEWFKKSFYQQVRNYPQFFGMLENTVIASEEERKRLQACTLLEGHNVNFSRAFDFLRKGRNAVPNLERVMELLRGITEKNAFDLEGLVSVSLALSTVDPHSKKIPSFKQVYEWCVTLATLVPFTLEPHFFLTMFLWPREDIGIGFDTGLFKLSKERLSTLYKEQCPKRDFRHVQAYKRMTTTGFTRAMPATNFFLSTGKGLQTFLHISSLSIESQKNFDRDQFWESDKVQQTLRRLEGMCLDTGKISFRVRDAPSIEIRTSRPIMQKGASQDKVSFFLGFSWEGPIAYHVKVHDDL
ncbi:sterile alpha motif domain-containing protein 9-like isoform X2 [Branchiostoma floridae x Branchiostoma japonicum]